MARIAEYVAQTTGDRNGRAFAAPLRSSALKSNPLPMKPKALRSFGSRSACEATVSNLITAMKGRIAFAGPSAVTDDQS